MTRRQSSGRGVTTAIFVIFGIVAIAGYAWLGLWFKGQLESRIVRFTENQLWAVFQMQKETLQTLRSMERVINGDLTVNTDDLILDYDILISRINLVGNGKRYQELRSVESLDRILNDLNRTIGQIDIDLERTGRYALAVAELIHHNLKPYELRLERAITEVIHFVSDRSDRYNLETARLLTVLQWAFVGNIVCLILALLIIYRTVKRVYKRRAREDRRWIEQQYRDETVRHAKDLTLAVVVRGLVGEVRRPIKTIASNLNSMQEHVARSTSVAGSSSSAGDNGMSNADMRETLRQMTAANARSLELIRGLQRFADPVHNPEPSVAISTALERVALLMTKADANSKLQVSVKGELPTIPGRRDVLVHVLINLVISVNHAIGLTDGATGRTTITATQGDGKIVIRVHDAQLAIPTEIVEMVRSPDRVSISMDLGDWHFLVVCPSIIAAEFNGTIEIEDHANSGQSIVVSLPLDNSDR